MVRDIETMGVKQSSQGKRLLINKFENNLIKDSFYVIIGVLLAIIRQLSHDGFDKIQLSKA